MTTFKTPDLPRVGEWIYGVAATADGARVLAADWQGRLSCFDVESRKMVAQTVPLAIAQ